MKEERIINKYQYLGRAFCDVIRSHCPFYTQVLDVGCGHGIASDYMRKLCDKLVLIDPSPYAYGEQLQRWRGDDKVYVQCCDIHAISGKFDLIYYFLSLHHIPNPTKELSKVRELLTRSGELVICEIEPIDSSPFHGKENVPYDGFPPSQIYNILKENQYLVKQTNDIGKICKNQLSYNIYMVICTAS